MRDTFLIRGRMHRCFGEILNRLLFVERGNDPVSSIFIAQPPVDGREVAVFTDPFGKHPVDTGIGETASFGVEKSPLKTGFHR